jgi:HEAT repeat protein
MLGRVDWDPDVVEALIKATEDHERPKRFEPGGWAPKSKPPSVHERAVLSLAEIGSEKSLSLVIPIFAGWDRFAKQSDIGQDTVELLSRIGLKAPESLIEAVQDESLRGEQTARIATALGKTELPGFVPVLNKLLNHQDKKVQKAAKKALDRLDQGG